MRFPKTPPAWQPLMDRVIQQGKADAFFQASHRHEIGGRYLHWDDFRHRVSDHGGLSTEEQWAAVRMSRALRSQSIPLEDTQGRPFTFFITPETFGLLHEIDAQCGVSGGLGGSIVREEAGRNLFDSVMEEALTSSQLEGAVVTRSEAREMIRHQRPPASEHERMVMNNFRTMRLLTKLKDEPLTPELILRIHREVTAGTLANSSHEGQFRSAADDVRVEDDESGEVFHRPPPADALHQRIAKLCEFANEVEVKGFLHPVLRSISLHFWVAYDHPFVDGNGRTARALFYWSMLRNGYWLAEFFSISQQILHAPKHYYRAFLHTETDANDLNYFILHQLDVVRSSIDSLRESLRVKREEAEALRKNLGAGGGFNHRQIALLKHALKHPFAAYTVAGHQNSHGTSNQTAKNDLVDLEEKNLLLRSKVGKAFVYSPALDLTGKLGFTTSP